MMNNYYGFFTQHPDARLYQEQLGQALNRPAPERRSLAESGHSALIDKIRQAAEQGGVFDNGDVSLGVSEEQQLSKDLPAPPPDMYDDKTYEPEPGVIVHTDKPQLAGQPDVDRRITQVEGTKNGAAVDSEALNAVVETATQLGVKPSALLTAAGALTVGTESLQMTTRVDVGHYGSRASLAIELGGGDLYERPERRQQDKVEMSFQVALASGNRVSLAVSVSDTTNTEAYKGVSRTVGINFSADQALSEEDAEAVSSLMSSLDNLLDRFNHDKSVAVADIDAFSATVAEQNDAVVSLGASLSFSDDGPRESYRRINFTTQDDGTLQHTSSEKDMESYYANGYQPDFIDETYRQGFEKYDMPFYEYYDDLEAAGLSGQYIDAVVNTDAAAIQDRRDYFESFFK